jgi:hypothetical protein
MASEVFGKEIRDMAHEAPRILELRAETDSVGLYELGRGCLMRVGVHVDGSVLVRCRRTYAVIGRLKKTL